MRVKDKKGFGCLESSRSALEDGIFRQRSTRRTAVMLIPPRSFVIAQGLVAQDRIFELPSHRSTIATEESSRNPHTGLACFGVHIVQCKHSASRIPKPKLSRIVKLLACCTVRSE